MDSVRPGNYLSRASTSGTVHVTRFCVTAHKLARIALGLSGFHARIEAACSVSTPIICKLLKEY